MNFVASAGRATSQSERRKGHEECTFEVCCSGDVMIFNKNSSLPRIKNQQEDNMKSPRQQSKKEKAKGEKSRRNSRGLKEISQTVILRVWRLGDRPGKRKKQNQNSSRILRVRRMKIHAFCLKMYFFILLFLHFSSQAMPFGNFFFRPTSDTKR